MLTTRQRFNAPGMVAAFEAERKARKLTQASGAGQVRVVPSTIRNMATGAIVEMDGVLFVTGWMGRPVESFYRDPDDRARGEPHAYGRRMDAQAVYAKLAAKKDADGWTWAEAAHGLTVRSGVPIGPSGLTRLKDGGRMSLYHSLAIAEWLGVSVASLTRRSQF